MTTSHYYLELRRLFRLPTLGFWEPLWREGLTFSRAFRAACFLLVHVISALLLVAAITAIQRLLIGAGDPKLYGWIPLRYVFDTMDLGVLLAFFLFGFMEVYILFYEQYVRPRK